MDEAATPILALGHHLKSTAGAGLIGILKNLTAVGNGDSYNQQVSADGSVGRFYSYASNLTESGTAPYPYPNIFLFDYV